MAGDYSHSPWPDGSREPLPQTFFRRPADEVAPDLLGRLVIRRLEEETLVLRIVETEAYLGVGDRASHAWSGRRTPRTASLFRAGGCAYVYLIYGLHHCLNAVSGEEGDGSAVLIRAGEPLVGVDAMILRRRLQPAPRPGAIAGGPGKLCQALAIDRSFDGVALDGTDLEARGLALARGEPPGKGRISVGPRIGVAYAGEAAAWPLRFAELGNPHVSRPFPRG